MRRRRRRGGQTGKGFGRADHAVRSNKVASRNLIDVAAHPTSAEEGNPFCSTFVTVIPNHST